MYLNTTNCVSCNAVAKSWTCHLHTIDGEKVTAGWCRTCIDQRSSLINICALGIHDHPCCLGSNWKILPITAGRTHPSAPPSDTQFVYVEQVHQTKPFNRFEDLE